jgi:hypothetical protein
MGLMDHAETPGSRRDITAAGQFEVSFDAPPTAPLGPLDAVHYSVTPGVLPTGGAGASVSPVVPPNPDGSQSVQDIDAAVEG